MNSVDRPSPFEIELKLLASPPDLASLRRRIERLVPGASPPVRHHVVTAYYDTPDLALADRCVALRLRRVGSRYTQSVKARQVAGTIKRDEWEWLIDGDTLDIHHLKQADIGGLISPHELPMLRPIFTTDVHRTTFRIRTDEGSEIELALDEGMLKAGGATTPICEVELELKSTTDEARGSAQLFHVALGLHRAVPMLITTISKADIGYELVAGRAAPSVKGTAVILAPETSIGRTISTIIRGCLAHILGNQAAILAGSIEGVHQMRVGLRQMRAAFGLFHRFIGATEGRWFAQEFKWLSGELGSARDWEVLALETLSGVKEDTGVAIEAIVDAVRTAQRDARERLGTAIRSPRYTTLMLTLGAWVETGGWSVGLDYANRAMLDEPVLQIAGGILERRARRAAKDGKRIGHLDQAGRHELRKALKKLRYSAAFLESLYPEELTGPYLRALSELQDVLGALNDLTVGRQLLVDLDRAGNVRGDGAVPALMAILDRRLARTLDRLPDAWHRFGKIKPFWS